MTAVKNTKAFAASIAGSDTSSGAGVQMDLRTMNACGVWGLTVIAALTAQNANHVTDTSPVNVGLLKSQIKAIKEDFDVGCWKTGMLCDSKIVRAVSESLPNNAKIVVDPVLISTSNYRLLDKSGQDMLCAELIPRALMVTPNLMEASAISGIKITDAESMEQAAVWFLDMGAKSVIVKGGHAHFRRGVDLYADNNGKMLLNGEVFEFSDVHGSGCCFSSAIASYIALGYPLRESVSKAKEFVCGAMKYSFEFFPERRTMNPNWQTNKDFVKRIL